MANKSDNPKLIRKQTAQRFGFSVSSIKTYRGQTNMSRSYNEKNTTRRKMNTRGSPVNKTQTNGHKSENNSFCRKALTVKTFINKQMSDNIETNKKYKNTKRYKANSY